MSFSHLPNEDYPQSGTKPAGYYVAESKTTGGLTYEEGRDAIREFLETIAFVVFLVLLLKLFVAEAYVIPTGSMATTLLGEHMHFTCPRCEYKYVVNAQDQQRPLVPQKPTCPNCMFPGNGGEVMQKRGIDGGDKVIVLKPLFDFGSPQRLDTVVFKYPGRHTFLNGQFGVDRVDGGPQKDFIAQNFIKRLWGLPGEKLMLWYGDVYSMEKGSDALGMIRKAPDKMLRMRRIVNDNDKIAPTHISPFPSNWQPDDDLMGIAGDTCWQAKEAGRVYTCVNKPDMHWLRFQNVVRRVGGVGAIGKPPEPLPELITDFLEYNETRQLQNYVSDLMIETHVETQSAGGTLTLEINAGVDHHRAAFDLTTGKCVVTSHREGELIVTAEQATKLLGKGTFLVRFCNFDQRLTLWVDGTLPFGDGVELPIRKPSQQGPRLADYYPVSIGAKGCDLSVKHLSVWRDIYYTREPARNDHQAFIDTALAIPRDEFRNVLKTEAQRLNVTDIINRNVFAANAAKRQEWLPLYPPDVQFGGKPGYFPKGEVYPKQDPTHHPSDRFNDDEFFMMGDNSPQSSDGRDWGQVRRHMILGKAVWVYWPYQNFMLIR